MPIIARHSFGGAVASLTWSVPTVGNTLWTRVSGSEERSPVLIATFFLTGLGTSFRQLRHNFRILSANRNLATCLYSPHLVNLILDFRLPCSVTNVRPAAFTATCRRKHHNVRAVVLARQGTFDCVDLCANAF